MWLKGEKIFSRSTLGFVCRFTASVFLLGEQRRESISCEPVSSFDPYSTWDSIVLGWKLSVAFDEDDDDNAKNFMADSGTSLNQVLCDLSLQNFCFSLHKHKVVGVEKPVQSINFTFSFQVSSTKTDVLLAHFPHRGWRKKGNTKSVTITWKRHTVFGGTVNLKWD